MISMYYVRHYEYTTQLDSVKRMQMATNYTHALMDGEVPDAGL